MGVRFVASGGVRFARAGTRGLASGASARFTTAGATGRPAAVGEAITFQGSYTPSEIFPPYWAPSQLLTQEGCICFAEHGDDALDLVWALSVNNVAFANFAIPHGPPGPDGVVWGAIDFLAGLAIPAGIRRWSAPAQLSAAFKTFSATLGSASS